MIFERGKRESRGCQDCGPGACVKYSTLMNMTCNICPRHPAWALLHGLCRVTVPLLLKVSDKTDESVIEMDSVRFSKAHSILVIALLFSLLDMSPSDPVEHCTVRIT